jgi:hypothetical protein
MVWSRWDLPQPLQPTNVRAVSALASWVEGRYRVTPRIFVAARADHLGFSDIRGRLVLPAGAPWDAPVRRLEGNVGYYLQRNLVLRAGVQGNWREGGRDRQRTYFAAQLAYWF